MQSISAIGIFVSIIYALLIINKKEKSFSDRILIVWMFLFAVHLVLPFMMAIGNRFFIEKVNGLDIGFYTLHISIMYYYALSITHNIRAISVNHLKFLVPTLIVYAVQGCIDRNTYYFSELINQHFFGDTKVFHLTGVVILNLTFCIYFSRKTFNVLRAHRKSIRDNYSYSENIDLYWLRNLTIAALIFTVILALYLLALINGRLNEEWINNYYFTSFGVFAIVLGYWGFKQGVIAIDNAVQNEKQYVKKKTITLKDSETKNKIETVNYAAINKKNTKEIQDLLKLMEKEKPYLDPKLNIGTIANSLRIHSHQLSKLINQNFGHNFFEFVNNYRVEEFKKLVANPKNKNFSILGLALDSGFNSKATFNRIFKNHTGQTPSEFRDNFKFWVSYQFI